MATILQQCKAARHKYRTGNTAEAKAMCLEILKPQPNNLFAHRLLATIGLETGSQDSLQHIQQSSVIDPQDAMAVVGKAVFAEFHRETDTAIDHFQRASQLDPSDGRIREEIERLGGAIEETTLGKAVASLQSGDAAGAIELLKASNGDDQAATLTLARAQWAQGAIEQAVALAQQVLAVNPQSIAALMTVVAAETRRGRALRVREFQTRADAIDPGFSLHPDLASLLSLPVGR